MCARTPPVQQGALHCSTSSRSSSCLTPLRHHRRHSLCVFPRVDASHLDEPPLLCVLVIYRTSAAVRWSTARGRGRFLEGAAVFAECFVRAKKSCLQRRAAGKAKCCSPSRVFTSLVSSSSGSCAVERGTSVNIWVHRLCLAFPGTG